MLQECIGNTRVNQVSLRGEQMFTRPNIRDVLESHCREQLLVMCLCPVFVLKHKRGNNRRKNAACSVCLCSQTQTYGGSTAATSVT